MSSSSSPKLVILQSSDNQIFEVDEEIARKSETIKNMIDDGYTNTTIPLHNITGLILAKVIENCKHHQAEGEDTVKKFDAGFVQVDDDTLFQIILATNYLNAKELLDLMCQTVADKIEDMKVEDVRKLFNVKNDFNPKEEEALRNKHRWAFQD